MRKAVLYSTLVLALMLLIYAVGSWRCRCSPLYGSGLDMAMLHALCAEEHELETMSELLQAHPDVKETVPVGGHGTLRDAAGDCVPEPAPFEQGACWHMALFVLADEGLQAKELVFNNDRRVPIRQALPVGKRCYCLRAELPVDLLSAEPGERSLCIAVDDAPPHRFRVIVHVAFGARVQIKWDSDMTDKNER